MSTEIKNLKQISNKLSSLGHGMGTDQFYHRLNKRAVYTDGMKNFFELAEAQWLYDVIETEFYDALKKLATPDKYYLMVTSKDNEANIVLTDYRDNEIHKRHIGFTDLPEGEILFYMAYMEYQDRAGNWTHRVTTCLPIED